MKKITYFILIAVFGFNVMLHSQSSSITTDSNLSKSKKGGDKGIDLNVKVFLEGAFNGTDMNTDLNTQDIPLTQPFNIEPWNYTGSESVSSIPNADVVDWVLLEARDATSANTASPSKTIDRQAAFLLKDGSIVSIDGSSKPQFSGTVVHDLFILIYHRNHLPVLSANPLTLTGGEYVYDFTTPAGQAYGTGAQKDLGSVYAMYGGDSDASENIDMVDKEINWLNDAGKTGYYHSDLNMDKEVNNPDKNDIWEPNLGKKSQLPGSCGGQTVVSLPLPDNCNSGGAK